MQDTPWRLALSPSCSNTLDDYVFGGTHSTHTRKYTHTTCVGTTRLACCCACAQRPRVEANMPLVHPVLVCQDAVRFHASVRSTLLVCSHCLLHRVQQPQQPPRFLCLTRSHPGSPLGEQCKHGGQVHRGVGRLQRQHRHLALERPRRGDAHLHLSLLQCMNTAVTRGCLLEEEQPRRTALTALL